MKVYEILTEDGRIVKGVNTTVDVGVNQIPIEAKKMGFTVDKDGHPPTLSSKVKGKSTNVLFNLGLTESKMKLFKYFMDVTGRSAANKAPKRTVDPVTKYDPIQHKENFIQKQMAKGKTRAEAEAQASAMTKKGYFDPKNPPKEVPKTKVKQQDIDAFKVWLKKHGNPDGDIDIMKDFEVWKRLKKKPLGGTNPKADDYISPKAIEMLKKKYPQFTEEEIRRALQKYVGISSDALLGKKQ